MEKGWTLVYTLTAPHQAEMAKQILEEQGITAVVINKRDSSYTTFGSYEVYTSDKDVETAREILNNTAF